MQFQHYKWYKRCCKLWCTWGYNQKSAGNLSRISQIASPNVIEIASESVYGTHLRMLSKTDVRVQMDAKSGQLKNDSKIVLFSVPGDVQESANGTTINAF